MVNLFGEALLKDDIVTLARLAGKSIGDIISLRIRNHNSDVLYLMDRQGDAMTFNPYDPSHWKDRIMIKEKLLSSDTISHSLSEIQRKALADAGIILGSYERGQEAQYMYFYRRKHYMQLLYSPSVMSYEEIVELPTERLLAYYKSYRGILFGPCGDDEDEEDEGTGSAILTQRTKFDELRDIKAELSKRSHVNLNKKDLRRRMSNSSGTRRSRNVVKRDLRSR